MYRQIEINPEDRDWLRIVYRMEGILQHFRLCTVTYGTAPAAYQAQRIIKQIIKDECQNNPQLASILDNQIYVDDIFVGADSIEQLSNYKHELIRVFNNAKIKLAKWSSNNLEVLSDIDNVEQKDKSVEVVDNVNALGLNWSPRSDEFFFSIKVNQKSIITKRVVLSESSKLYDPLGWLSPILIGTKILMQDLWIHGFDWDSPLTEEFVASWKSIQSELDQLSSIRISRWLGGASNTEWSLHGFSEASKRAYAAAIYFVPMNGQSHLIFAKTRISPVKTLSIPRLELMGAVLLAELINWMLPSFQVPPKEIQCWCDSRNVLCWLEGVPARWGIFEGNRVSKILDAVPNVHWRYVKSAENPADCATRNRENGGLSVKQLKDFSLWWKGPSWLKNKADWPPDISRSVISVNVVLNEEHNLIQDFSSLNRLIRIAAICKRWLKKVRPSYADSSKTRWLSSSELKEAKIGLIRFDQKTHFSKEIELLENGRKINSKSVLILLNPILDKNNLLRVGGRLSNCNFITYDEKHPILLSKNSHLAKLVINDAHEKTLHGGPQLVMSQVLRKFWIIHGKRIIRHLISKCTKCIRYSSRIAFQQMSSLPEFKVNPQRPFQFTGLDYAGPIQVRCSKGRGIKSSKG